MPLVLSSEKNNHLHISSKKDVFQNSLEMSSKETESQGSNENRLFQKRIHPSTSSSKLSGAKENAILSPVLNRSRALSTPEVQLNESNGFAGAFPKSKRKVMKLSKKDSKLRSMSSPNMKTKILSSNSFFVDGHSYDEEHIEDRLTTPNKLYLPKMDSNHSTNLGMSLQSISRSSTPGRDIDLEVPRTRQSVTPVGGRPVHSQYYSPRKASSAVRLNPLAAPNVATIRESEDVSNQSDFDILSSSPILTASSKAHYHFEPVLPSSFSSTHATSKALNPVLEEVTHNSDSTSALKIAPQSSTSDDDSAFFHQSAYNPVLRSNSDLQKDLFQALDSRVERVSPPLIDCNVPETPVVGKVLDFQSLVAKPRTPKKFQEPVQSGLIKSSAKPSAGMKSPGTPIIVPALAQSSAFGSLSMISLVTSPQPKPDCANIAFEKSSAVGEQKSETLQFNLSDKKSKPAVDVNENNVTVGDGNSSIFANPTSNSSRAADEESKSSDQIPLTETNNSKPDFSSMEQPKSLELFVSEQDEAVRITINLSCDDRDDIKSSHQASELSPAREKPKSKSKAMSTRATEATNRLYKKPKNVDNLLKTDAKKPFKQTKTAIKKDPQIKLFSKKSGASKTVSKLAKPKQALSANTHKKKSSSALSIEMNARGRSKSANNGATQKQSDLVSTPLHSETDDTSSTKNSRTSNPSNQLKLLNASVAMSSVDKAKTSSRVNVPEINNDVTSENKTDGFSENDVNTQNLNKLEGGENGEDPLGKNEYPKTTKRYNQAPVQTPIIVNAFPSPDEAVLLEKVALIKVVPPSKRAKTAQERKKKPLKLPLGRSKQGQKKSSKKTQNDDVFFNINDSRAKSAGLTVEHRGSKSKKSNRKSSKALYEQEEEEEEIDFDNSKEALISGLKWSIKVDKNESGEHLVMKDKKINSDCEDNNLSVRDFGAGVSKPGKLSPIAEVLSLHSSVAKLIDEHTPPNDLIKNEVVNEPLTDRRLSGEDDQLKNDDDSNLTSPHRPDSSLSILSLQNSPIAHQVAAYPSNSPNLTKNTAWVDSPADDAISPSDFEEKREQPAALNRNVMLVDDLLAVDEKSNDARISRDNNNQSSASEESESEDELESYLRKLHEPRSEMDARILRRPSSSGSDYTGGTSTLNSDTLQSTSTLRDVQFVDDGVNAPYDDDASVTRTRFLHARNDQSNIEPPESKINKRMFVKHIEDYIASTANSHLDPSAQYDLTNGNVVTPDDNRDFYRRSGSVGSVGSDNDSENEMLDNLHRTLHAPDTDDSETVRAESECSLPIVEISDEESYSSKTGHVSRLTKSALKRHNSKLDLNDFDEVADRTVSRLSEHSGRSYTTDMSLLSIADLNTEQCLGWKKGRLLDQGSFGKVWEGMTHGGQLIAVKQVELSMTCHHDAQKEFQCLQREVDILKDMRHPNIVSFIGTCLEENVVSIFMEYLTGGSISKILLNFGELPEPVFKKYTRQMLEGVKYLHERNVVHRDINGNNVMLLPNGIIKLIDFGCSKRIHHRSIACSSQNSTSSGSAYERQLKSVVGTPYWMAPEVITGKGHGPKSDIWSVGCTVVEMATTRPPLHHLNPTAAMFHIGDGRPMPRLPKHFTKRAKSFVEQCLKHDLESRPAAVALLAHKFLKGKKDVK